MARRALLCGCNYPGSSAPLNGCINDCLTMRELLETYFGFQAHDITMMLDTEPSTPQPTGANIKAKLKELVAASRPGDVLFFHFSGHGTQVPDDGESDGYDEAICPSDMNIICDDDLRDIFAPLPHGVKLTMLADCCHSGTLLDHPVVTIAGPKDGEAVPNLSGVMGMLLGRGVDPEGDVEGAREIKNRALPTQSFLSMLSSQLGAGVGKGNIRASLTQLFGNASSAKAINYSQLMGQGSAAMGMAQKGDFSGCVPLLGALFGACMAASATSGGGGGAPGEPNLAIQHAGGGASREEKMPEHTGILITGCQSHETSADACPSGNPDQAFGALSNGIKGVLSAHFQQNGPGAPISYRTLVTGVRESLSRGRFSQNPCLECSERNADTNFILP